ncbi:MAG TPA: LptA/OstA family protein [Patescibacteria group bacterium]|nr:LptA/OstA family protein [Patescibacteria group bacterium]
MNSRILITTFLLLTLLTGTVIAAPVISADNKYLDISTGLYVLNGNVRIETGSRVITAGQAKANMLSMEVWGTGGVTVTQDDISFSGNQVYVNGPQSQAQIEGNIVYSRTGLQVTAESAEYNWRNRTAMFSGNVQVTENGATWTADRINYNLETNSFYN